MHADEVRSKLFLTFYTCRRIQMQMVGSLAPRLAGMSPAEIKAEMTSALNDSYSAIRSWAVVSELVFVSIELVTLASKRTRFLLVILQEIIS